jgi:hypothetical protein
MRAPTVKANTPARRARALAGTHPHLAELAKAGYHDGASVVGQGCDDEFEFALDLLLVGLERLRQQEPSGR